MLAAILAPLISVPAYPQCAAAPKAVTEFGTLNRGQESLGLNRISISKDGASYLRARLHLTAPLPAGCPWILSVRDRNLRLVETLTAADFASTFRWTTRVSGNRLFLQVEPCPGGVSPGIERDLWLSMPKEAEVPFYSLQGPNPVYRHLDEIGNAQFAQWGDSVGILTSSFQNAAGQPAPPWVCSGVLVAQNLFLTNWHCGGPAADLPAADFWNAGVVASTMIDLSWDGDDISREYSVTRVEAKDQDLDFALLRVQPQFLGTRSRPARLRGENAVPNSAVTLIHHARGDKKLVSEGDRGCRVQDVPALTRLRKTAGVAFTHTCDTEQGSSGGPVFDAEGRVIGLHHWGFDFDESAECRPDRRNKAIQMKAILGSIGSQRPELLSELTVQ